MEINNLISKKYQTFSSFLEEYQRVEQALIDLEKKLTASTETQNGLTLQDQLTLYNLVIEHTKNPATAFEYTALKEKLLSAYPAIGDYFAKKGRIGAYKDTLDDILLCGINLCYDEQPHLYIPTESGIKCLLTSEEISGCQTPEEVALLQKAAAQRGILVYEYLPEDANYVEEYLNYINFKTFLRRQADVIGQDVYDLNHLDFKFFPRRQEDVICQVAYELNQRLKSKHEADEFINTSQSPVPKKTL